MLVTQKAAMAHLVAAQALGQPRERVALQQTVVLAELPQLPLLALALVAVDIVLREPIKRAGFSALLVALA